MTHGQHNLLVVGVGNLLMMDDGIGCHLAAALKRRVIPGARVLDVGTSVIHVLADIEQAQAVLFLDAFQGGGAAGARYLLDARETLSPRTTVSLHEVGIAATLRELGPEHQQKPLVLFGVEPAVIDFGMQLSPALAAVFSALEQTALHLAREMTWPDFSLAQAHRSIEIADRNLIAVGNSP